MKPGSCRHLAMFSGGLSSWAAAKRFVAEYGVSGLVLLFADTLIEDEDLYRFLVEAAANVYSKPLSAVAHLAAMARSVPPVEDDRWADRVVALSRLRREASEAIPGLAWIADGREPWQVFADERFIGNSKVDPCSKILKRKLMDRWRDEHCVNWRTILVFGLDWSERGRIYGDAKKPGHKRIVEGKGWRPVYPLDDRPYLIPDELRDWAESEGLRVPRLYDLGFSHNNCGGFCVKAGFAQMKRLLSTLPDRYRWHERREADVRREISTVSTVLKYNATRRRRARNITLRRFRELIEQQGTLFDDYGDGCGGGCALDDEMEPAKEVDL